ncbi:hypothetical protein AF335_03220 [Streptomyces eurocidicus]|uniref:Uncharacterized protein n=1 Tax=Streptomyces eurocidicus TaxID=66423 RepID=A0A2N8P2Y1_STREU|nr:hypothetical protein AF335_03220 [Streptomyces eurocidicus]
MSRWSLLVAEGRRPSPAGGPCRFPPAPSPEPAAEPRAEPSRRSSPSPADGRVNGRDRSACIARRVGVWT